MLAIVGAGGGLGRSVANHVLDEGGAGDLLLVTRAPDNLAALEARGACVRQGDSDDLASLIDALRGATRVLLISTPGHVDDTRRRRHRTTIDATVCVGAEHVLYTSAVSVSDTDSSMLLASHRATEQMLADSGLGWTVLRNSLYAEFVFDRWVAAGPAGVYRSNAGAGRAGYVTRADCAAVTAAVLTSGGHAGAVYDVTGPELVDDDAIAAIVAERIGRAAPVEQVDDAVAAADYEAVGLPPDASQVYASFLTGVREGAFERCTSVVPDLTGRPAMSIAQLFEDRRAELATAWR